MHANAMMSSLHRANAPMPYKIERDPEVPIADDQRCYVVTMDDGANILHVTVTTKHSRIRQWADIATNSGSGPLVGIHAEPRLFKSKLVHTSLQPRIHVLFIAIGNRVLVVEQRLAVWTLLVVLNRLHFDPYQFVGMHMERFRQLIPNASDVGKLVADQTGREELRTAGLKKISQEVMGIALDPVLSRRFWLKRWFSGGLSPELVMQGSIRVFMAFLVARRIRNYPPLPQLHDQQQQQAAGSSSGHGSQPQLHDHDHDQQQQEQGGSGHQEQQQQAGT